jgi:hypothetical protein
MSNCIFCPDGKPLWQKSAETERDVSDAPHEQVVTEKRYF